MNRINHISRPVLVGLGLLFAGATVVPMSHAQAQAANSVPDTLIQQLDQAVAAGNAAGLNAAAAAIIAAASGDTAALSAAVTAAVAGAPAAQAPAIVAAFVSNSPGNAVAITTAGVAGAPGMAPQIAAAAAAVPAAQAQAAAIVVAAIQGLPAGSQTTDEGQAIATAVQQSVPGATQQITAAISQLNLGQVAQNNPLPTTLAPISPH